MGHGDAANAPARADARHRRLRRSRAAAPATGESLHRPLLVRTTERREPTSRSQGDRRRRNKRQRRQAGRGAPKQRAAGCRRGRTAQERRTAARHPTNRRTAPAVEESTGRRNAKSRRWRHGDESRPPNGQNAHGFKRPNVEVQGRCAASSRSVPWNDGLGHWCDMAIHLNCVPQTLQPRTQ